MSTVTYVAPVSVAPSTIQALGCNIVVAQVVFSSADTVATVTHNFGIILGAGGQASLNPICIITPIGVDTVNPAVGVTLATNTVTVNKGSTVVGTDCTLAVYVMRPFSMIQ